MLLLLLIALLLTIATVIIHALGTSWWIQFLRRRNADASNRTPHPISPLCGTAALLLFLHTAEVLLWAGVYLLLPAVGTFSNLEEAVYFSMVTFTTLGYGDIVISGPWRLLASIQAMTGLLIFGWSTALFFSVFERLWVERIISVRHPSDGPQADV